MRGASRWGLLGALVLLMAAAAQADTVQYQVSASINDAATTSSGCNYATTSIYFPYSAAAPGDRPGFFRWAVNIPAGATITSAYLKVNSYATQTTASVVRMQLVDSDNCPALNSPNPYSHSTTATYVDWTLPAEWTEGTWYTSPDISALVQEFVNRAGYSPGSYLGLKENRSSGGLRQIRQWDYGDHTYGAILEVTYTAGNAAPAAEAGDDQSVSDSDDSGYETVTLDGSGSSDSDGTIVSWVWTEGAAQIATGQTAHVSLAVGTHTITLTVTDDDAATAQDTVASTVIEGQVMTVVLAQSEPEDDTYATSTGTNYLTSSMYFPYTNADRRAFHRWRCLVPPNATVVDARLRIRAYPSAGNQNPSAVQVQLIDRDDCPGFSVNPFAIDVISGGVSWTLPGGAWVDNAEHESPDLKDLVQAYIDRAGFTFGSHLGLRSIWTSGSYKMAYQWDYGDHTRGAVLEVSYTGGDVPVELWMADPETRLDQKIYCQIFNGRDTYTLRAKLDGDVIHTHEGDLLPEAGEAGREYVFVADYSELAAGEHTLLVEILDASDEVVGSASRTWTTLHDGIPAVGINKDNAICRNGTPYFPVMIFMWDKSKFTWPICDSINSLFAQGYYPTVNIASWQDYLTTAASYGWTASGPIKWDGYNDGYWDGEKLVDYVEACRSYSAMLMWSWDDEPEVNSYGPKLPATDIREMTVLTHANDTNHPVATTFAGYAWTHDDSAASNGEMQSYCFLYDAESFDGVPTCVFDAIGLDYYPYEYCTRFSFCSLSDMLLAYDRAQAWNYNLVPFYAVLETTDVRTWARVVGTSAESEWTPRPTADMIYNEAWAAVIHGAKGVQWFAYFDSTPTENLNAMETFKDQVLDLAQAVLSSADDVTVNVTDTESSGRVDLLVRQYEDNLYLFAADIRDLGDPPFTPTYHDENATYTWNIPSGDVTVTLGVEGLAEGTVITVYDEDRTIVADDGSFEDTFSPLEVHIYVWDMDNVAPTVDAGDDLTVTDTMPFGNETITLDGSGSTDSDGTITSYVWTEGATQIATGATAQVSLTVGTHTITLTVTDDDGATASEEVVVTINPGQTTAQCQVAASFDDTYCTSSGNLPSTTTMYWPYSSDARRAFLRWSITIPDGATIVSASLRLKSAGTGTGTSTIRLQLVDQDSCPALGGTGVNPFSWSVAASPYVDWTEATPLATGEWYQTGAGEDLKDLVQAFIDRPGYASGNYLGLRGVWTSGSWKQTYQRDNGAADGAVLEVTYTAP
jgi:hypothetical protein